MRGDWRPLNHVSTHHDTLLRCNVKLVGQSQRDCLRFDRRFVSDPAFELPRSAATAVGVDQLDLADPFVVFATNCKKRVAAIAGEYSLDR
jgi:hypothetical protein